MVEVEVQEQEAGEIRLEPILNNFIEDIFSGLSFCCPARIEGIQGVDQMRVAVKPLHMPRSLDNTTYEMPTIQNVPVVVCATEDGGILVSPKQGQTVLLVFPHCDIDIFKAGSTAPYESDTKRYLDINDAIALVGFTPFVNSPNQVIRHYTVHNIEDVTVFNNLGTAKENKVICHRDGSITIRTVKRKVTVDAKLTAFTQDVDIAGDAKIAGTLRVGKDLYVEGDIIIQGRSLLQFMNLHVHPYTDDGNPMETLPPVPL